jgi:2-polyprenyl-3-methyl-5-hydroxy-6-metoxy-1,4-benzoquinol methylase
VSTAGTPALTIAAGLKGALFHYGRLLGNGNRGLSVVRAALAATPDERVLDFGCGCGGFSRAVPGPYLGIDLDPDYIAFARWRWGSPRRQFATLRLEDLDPREPFDKAIVVNCLHHLSDAAATDVLGRLATLVRRRLVVMDLDPDASNRFQSFLISRDRGRFVRRPRDQRALIEPHFRVIDQRGFRYVTGTAVQVVFTCEPRA